MPLSMFNVLMDTSRSAAKQCYVDTAYHALAAAMHLAAEQKYMLGLKEVESVAIDHLVWVDRNVPEHPSSAESSRAREVVSVFVLLAEQARAKQSDIAHPASGNVQGARGRE